MKTILLVRHAKALKCTQNIGDMNRPLVESGILDALTMGKWLKKNVGTIDLMVSSPASRAYATALAIAQQADYPLNKIKLNKNLYECGEEAYVDLISSFKEEQKTVAMVGHNPDISFAANYFIKDFHEEMPTTGVIGIEFEVKRWEDIKRYSGRLKFFETPQ